MSRLLLLSFSLLLLFPAEATAKHLIGGEITYEYLSRDVNGRYLYRITLNLYRDCIIPVGETQQTPFDRPTTIGIYENVSGPTKPRVRIKSIFFNPGSDEIPVDVFDDSSSCPRMPRLCIRRGIISDTVALPPSQHGFVVVYPRCCRNAPDNLVENAGQTYAAVIPPTSVNNRSAYFDSNPVPIICTEDTAYLPTQAIDPDGDSLAYRLATPYDGGTATDPAPSIGPSFNYPPPTVAYNAFAGYSANQPLGPNGEIKVNAQTGIVQITPDRNRTGSFSYALEVLEYRNGQLIGTIRRDFQIIITPCQYNPPPTLKVNGQRVARGAQLVIEAGKDLSLDFTFSDTSAFRIEASGELAQSTSGQNLPDLQVPSGKNNLDKTATFTWDTRCDQARPSPYSLNFTAYDTDCPQRIYGYTFLIILKKPTKPGIVGPKEVCPAPVSNSHLYRVDRFLQNDSLSWQVPEGSFEASRDTGIRVSWPRNPQGYGISLWRTNPYGCNSDTDSISVSTFFVPEDSITGTPTVCPNNGGVAYEVTDFDRMDYRWFMNGATLQSADNKDRVQLAFSQPGTSQVNVARLSGDGCRDTLRKSVVVGYQLETPPITGPDSLCMDSNARADALYQVRPNGDAIYEWRLSPEGQFQGPQDRAQMPVRWKGQGRTATIAVLEKAMDSVNRKICLGDTFRFPVYLRPIPDPTAPQGQRQVCQGDTETYTSEAPQNMTLDWRWANASRQSIRNGGQEIQLLFEDTGRHPVQVRGTGAAGCRGPWKRTEVQVKATPLAMPILGPDTVCFGTTSPARYRLEGMAESRYDWSVAGGTVVQATNGNVLEVRWPDSLQLGHSVSVQETAPGNCKGPVNRLVVVLDKPVPEMVRVTTLPADDRKLEASWKINRHQSWPARLLTLQRARHNREWQDLVELAGSVRRHEDGGVATDRYAYRYRVMARDLCGADIPAEGHKSILLRLEKPNADDLALNWNLYSGWDETAEHTLRHGVGYGQPALDSVLMRPTNADTAYFMELGQQQGFRQCFRVKAEVPGNAETYSYSNLICENFAGNIHIPNAFTPNADAFNPAYRLQGYNVREVTWTVFNRWGAKVFSGKGLEQQWNGQCPDGPCPEGEYLLLLRYVDARGPQSRKQVVHLLR